MDSCAEPTNQSRGGALVIHSNLNQNPCCSAVLAQSHHNNTFLPLSMTLGRSLLRSFIFFHRPANPSCVLALQPKTFNRHIFVHAMSASPPPTPPSKAPDYEDRRFKNITSPCEWVEDYHPGGYHPVHLGDVFNNGQFKVIRKLGDGAYSTVWLARDLKSVKSSIIPH